MAIRDADGELVPKQDHYLVTLANGYTFAARGSGTEPKMKFYVFAQAPVADAAALPGVKAAVQAELDRVKALIEADAQARAEGCPPALPAAVRRVAVCQRGERVA